MKTLYQWLLESEITDQSSVRTVTTNKVELETKEDDVPVQVPESEDSRDENVLEVERSVETQQSETEESTDLEQPKDAEQSTETEQSTAQKGTSSEPEWNEAVRRKLLKRFRNSRNLGRDNKKRETKPSRWEFWHANSGLMVLQDWLNSSDINPA